MEFVSDGAAELVGYSSEAFERGDVSGGQITDRTERLGNGPDLYCRRRTVRGLLPIETADGETRWMWERGRSLTLTTMASKSSKGSSPT